MIYIKEHTSLFQTNSQLYKSNLEIKTMNKIYHKKSFFLFVI